MTEIKLIIDFSFPILFLVQIFYQQEEKEKKQGLSKNVMQKGLKHLGLQYLLRVEKFFSYANALWITEAQNC